VNGNKLEVIDCEDFFPLLALQLDIDPSVMTEPLLYGCQKLEVQGKYKVSAKALFRKQLHKFIGRKVI
jgi:hypothetical protein